MLKAIIQFWRIIFKEPITYANIVYYNSDSFNNRMDGGKLDLFDADNYPLLTFEMSGDKIQRFSNERIIAFLKNGTDVEGKKVADELRKEDDYHRKEDEERKRAEEKSRKEAEERKRAEERSIKEAEERRKAEREFIELKEKQRKFNTEINDKLYDYCIVL